MTVDEKNKNGCRMQVRSSLQALDQILDNPPGSLTPSELEVIVGKRAAEFKTCVDRLHDALRPTRTRG